MVSPQPSASATEPVGSFRNDYDGASGEPDAHCHRDSSANVQGNTALSGDVTGTTTLSYVGSISGVSGAAGTIAMGDGIHALTFQEVVSAQSTPPLLAFGSSTGYSAAASSGGAGAGLSLVAGYGGNGQGSSNVGGTGGAVLISAGSGGQSVGSGANSTGGAVTIATGSAVEAAAPEPRVPSEASR